MRDPPCNYGDILEDIQKYIIEYEMFKSALFTYLIQIAQ